MDSSAERSGGNRQVSATDRSWVVRLLRGLWPANAAAQQPRAPLLTFEMVAPLVREGWMARGCQRLWRHAVTAATASRVAAFVSEAVARIKTLEPAVRVAQGAWMVAIAAVTNLVMLTVVEQYHFPRRTALVFPAVVAVAALLVFAMSPDIARAAADKRDE